MDLRRLGGCRPVVWAESWIDTDLGNGGSDTVALGGNEVGGNGSRCNGCDESCGVCGCNKDGT